ncbi:PREDICTED: mitochondrial import receptor subunit TOM40-1-like [Camelina sativa]|uniref:Mitochondrial import receptor subunit TOM40-1-like n=1 Tax=Camelina sativa TaxID=90675 RepID=A0ABM0VN48_CAMSA|nr:PREDICTED: mitochondrial import receptor subunit TOM40-1-like [Camelina sativa]XP_010458691.1 PREDICTED: mitochondrial import receptor subunit TOM40-1-like [Camelina sativa]
MTYVHKISKKVSLATDFAYNCFSRDVKAGVGYDCNSKQSRVQGKIDSNGVVSALLGKELYVGLECLLSANLDHKNKKDYKLGLSLAYGSPVTTLFVK